MAQESAAAALLRLCAYWLTNSYGLTVSPSVAIKMLTE